MAAEIEFVSISTEPCPSCRVRHRHRVALIADEGCDRAGLLGFFGLCPTTSRRVWLVGPVPQGTDGRSRLLEIGPADADDWAPSRGSRSSQAPTRWIESGPAIPRSSPRGRDLGGFRVSGRAPEMLRLALGCPFA